MGGKHRARRAPLERGANITINARNILFFKNAVSLLKLWKVIFAKRRAAQKLEQSPFGRYQN